MVRAMGNLFFATDSVLMMQDAERVDRGRSRRGHERAER